MRSNYRFKVWLSVFLIFNSLLMAACDSVTASPTAPPGEGTVQDIQIYASLPLNGQAKNQGQSLVNAMQLALADVSGNTDIVGGFKIHLIALDDSAAISTSVSVQSEIANANKAAADPDAMLYLGPVSTAAAEAAIPILNKAGMAMVSPGTTYPGLTKAVPGVTQPNEPAKYYPTSVRNFFRLLPTDDSQGQAIANFTQAHLQAHRVYVVTEGGDYAIGLAKSYQQAARDNALDLLGYDSITPTNLTTIVNNIQKANPEVVFYSGSNSSQAAKLLTDLQTAGVKARFLGSSGIQTDLFLQAAGAAGKGAYSSISGVDTSSLSAPGQDFIKAYKAKYGDTVQASTIYGYDAMKVALTAIQVAGKKDRAAILQAITSTKQFEGATGNWNFDQNGDTSLTVFSFYLDKNQQWTFNSIVDTSPTNVSSPNQETPIAPPTVLATNKAQPTPGGKLTPTAPTAGAGGRQDAASQLPPPLQLFKLANLPVAVYLPPNSTNGQTFQVLLALHGMYDNGGHFGGLVLKFAEQYHLVLLAPTFNYNVNYKDPNVIINEDLKLTAQIDQLSSQLSQLTHIKLNDKLLLFGFSRGAQLSHHYAMLYPTHTLGAAVLSGGAYTLPQNEWKGQPLLFPFGVGNLENYTHQNFDQADFVKIHFDVQVGALDDDPSQVSRAWDNYLGTNRAARGQSYFQALLRDGVNAQFTLVPNTKHEVNPPQIATAEKFLQNLILHNAGS